MASLIYSAQGWGYESADGFYGYFDTRAEAVDDLEFRGYWTV